MLRLCRASLFAASLAASNLTAQAAGKAASPWPKTGVDYSGIDEFYRIADLYAKGAEPTQAQWTAMMATPGYRLVEIDNAGIRDRIELALSPKLRVRRDSILARESDQSYVLKHIIDAAGRRDAVMKMRAVLTPTIRDTIVKAVKAASRYLPPGTVEAQPVPYIAFAVFADDGYAEDPGVLLDPLYVTDSGLLALLSHEFHHCYTSTLDRTKGQDDFAASGPPADVMLAFALIHLRNEGIADQIDKPHPLPLEKGMSSTYVTRYNAAYDRTPAILHSIDSLLAGVGDNPGTARAAGQRARQLLYSNSHPNGAYMAREIAETFSIDSLMPGIRNPFAFIRAYEAAERKRGNPPPFSAKALAVLADMEKRYVKR